MAAHSRCKKVETLPCFRQTMRGRLWKMDHERHGTVCLEELRKVTNTSVSTVDILVAKWIRKLPK